LPPTVSRSAASALSWTAKGYTWVLLITWVLRVFLKNQ